ncbi:hypothetical protein TNIN_328621 [Trichonephila inaurata madagascariensis]|uniref:Uncharacterized protein n=1 Tax=Trichonephila inaurata madagascariensis TaxID=2747483 RepID=A0A8X6YHE4_9ARAC|nr:hypothetical protein TNIN_328621 [Trichonephila inaurata madagascariensis]
MTVDRGTEDASPRLTKYFKKRGQLKTTLHRPLVRNARLFLLCYFCLPSRTTLPRDDAVSSSGLFNRTVTRRVVRLYNETAWRREGGSSFSCFVPHQSYQSLFGRGLKFKLIDFCIGKSVRSSWDFLSSNS